MTTSPPHAEFGPVTVYFGEKTGKYPDGNQVIVRGRDATAAFDTPQVANRIGAALDTVDLVILGHVHEDHMAGLHRLPHAPVHVHEADLLAAQSWEGLSRHYGYPPSVLTPLKAKIEIFYLQKSLQRSALDVMPDSTKLKLRRYLKLSA